VRRSTLSSHFNPSFLLAELDPVSLDSARSNVDVNGLGPRITLLPAEDDGPIFPEEPKSDAHTSKLGGVTFTMCNPPFYESHEDILRSAEIKEAGPNTVSLARFCWFVARYDGTT
jgi:23S rRNA A1618 N6-methylase RlmF